MFFRRAFGICKALSVFVLLTGLFFFAGCSKHKGKKDEFIKNTEQMNSSKYTIGVPMGAASAGIAEKRFENAKIIYFDNLPDGYNAVKHGEIDGFLSESHNMEYMTLKNAELGLLSESLGQEIISVGLPKTTLGRTLRTEVNRFIAEYRRDGTYEEMRERWFSKNPGPMPEISAPPKPTQTLKVGTEGLNEPLTWFDKNGTLTGFDIEFIKRFALYANIKLEIVTMPFPHLISNLESGSIDMIVSSLNNTPEREDKILFSDVYLDSEVRMMVLKKRIYSASKGTKKIVHVDDLNDPDFKIGVELGTYAMTVAQERLPRATLTQFTTNTHLYPALSAGSVDAIAYDMPPMEYARRSYEDFHIMPTELAQGNISVGASLKHKDLMDRVNAFIRDYRANGTYREMYTRWVESERPEMPDIPHATNPSGKIIIGIDVLNEPMNFTDSKGQPTGFDIEFAKRLALYLNMEYELVVFAYDALFAVAASGKVDLVIAQLDATEERRQTMLFSEPYVDCPVAIMVRKDLLLDFFDESNISNGGFIKKMLKSFNRTFIQEHRWKLIISGLRVTLVITLFGAFFGTILGFGLCLMRRSKNIVLNLPAKWFIHLLQGIPILVFLMILYYVVFSKSDLDAVLVAIIGFAINFAVYVAEMMRNGAESINKAQLESAEALGLGRFFIFREIAFPQTIHKILPAYKEEFISMLKMTSVVGYIAIHDLTKMSDIIRSRTYESFFPLIVTALIYFITAHLLVLLLNMVEFKLDPLNRKRTIKGVTLK